MRGLRKVFVCLAISSRALSLIRKFVNAFRLNRNPDGTAAFPFLKRTRRSRAQILVYHRVNDEADPLFPGIPVQLFARQMEYVAENYTVCSLDQIVQGLRSSGLPKNALCITFDDGYKDNFLHAFPILKRLQLPATIFLATGAIGSGKLLWHDRLFSAFRRTKALRLLRFGSELTTYSLATAAQKQDALNAVLKFLWALPDAKRVECIDSLVENLRVEDFMNSDELMLDWKEIQAMSECNIQFGAHTVTHSILAKLAPADAKREIVQSKEGIERHLRQTVKHFAYPVGRREDFSDEIKALLQEAGYVSAVTTIAGSNSEGTDLYELHRATPWETDIDSFALRLAALKFVS